MIKKYPIIFPTNLPIATERLKWTVACAAEPLFDIQDMSLQATRAEQDLPHVQAFGGTLRRIFVQNLEMFFWIK